jgi:hypothetical protein
MKKRKDDFGDTFKTVTREVLQAPELRHPYLKAIESARNGRRLVSFFISFYSPVPLSQADADQLEEVLANTDCTKGITLLLDAPGGDGLAAERIISACRGYSKGDFETIVAARAKSAATMVCLGSDRILMSPTSELGPIDPQVPMDLRGTGDEEWVAAHHISSTYDQLFNEAKSLGVDQRIEPYLQQLQKFSAVNISQLKSATRLSENIAVKSLSNGMMKGKPEDEIKVNIKPFTDPDITMSHGRSIDCKQAKDCDLNIEEVGLDTDLWRAIWGLYIRSKYIVDQTPTSKLIDTLDTTYFV